MSSGGSHEEHEEHEEHEAEADSGQLLFFDCWLRRREAFRTSVVMEYHLCPMVVALQFFAMAAENEAPDPYSTWGTPENALLLIVCAILFGIWAFVMYRDMQKIEQKHLDLLRGILGPQWEVVSKEKCTPSHELYGKILHDDAFAAVLSPIGKRKIGATSQWVFRRYVKPHTSRSNGAVVAIERNDGRALPRVRVLIGTKGIPLFKSAGWSEREFQNDRRTYECEADSDEADVQGLLPYLVDVSLRHDCLIAIETSGEYIACIGRGETDEDGYRKVLSALADFSRDVERFEAPV